MTAGWDVRHPHFQSSAHLTYSRQNNAQCSRFPKTDSMSWVWLFLDTYPIMSCGQIMAPEAFFNLPRRLKYRWISTGYGSMSKSKDLMTPFTNSLWMFCGCFPSVPRGHYTTLYRLIHLRSVLMLTWDWINSEWINSECGCTQLRCKFELSGTSTISYRVLSILLNIATRFRLHIELCTRLPL